MNKKSDFPARIEKTLPAEKHEETSDKQRVPWKAEVQFPFLIRVPVDIAITIDRRTITVSTPDDELPTVLVEWLGTSFAHKDKLDVVL